MRRLTGGSGARPARGRRDEGQALIMVAIFLVVMLGLAGLVIDLGELYLSQRHLQTAADSAALAAAQDLPNDASAACAYSASALGATCTITDVNGNPVTQPALTVYGKNYSGNFGGAQTSVQLECLSAASAGTSCRIGGTGTPCPTTPGCNAIKVTEQQSVTPFFMQVLGFGAQSVSASATAGIAGGSPHPLNVEVVDDATESMQCPGLGIAGVCESGQTGATICGGLPTDVPASVINTLTQEDCAKAGIRALLTQLLPCYPSNSTCLNIPSSNQTQSLGGALDDVGLVTFPGLVSGGGQTIPAANSNQSVPQELNCSADLGVSNVSYGSNANYQIVPFSSDFRLSDTATTDPLATLNPTSDLVQSVYWPGDGCGVGGYPIPSAQGAAASSIAGGTVNDVKAANNNTSSPIAFGASQTAVGSGITTGNSVAQTNSSPITQGTSTTNASGTPITQGNSTTATNPSTIAGGVSVANNRTSPANVTAASSITVPAPANYVVGNFELVTVTARGLPTGAAICPPVAAPTWNVIATATAGSGASAITQTTFWTTTSSTGSDIFTTFSSSACTGTTHPAASEISAVSIAYTNVDTTVAPLVSTANNPTGTSLTAPALANVPANDMVVSIFGADAAFNGTQPTYDRQGTLANPVSTGADDSIQATAGNAPQPVATVSATGAWTAQTIALSPAPASSITVVPPSDYSPGGNDFLLVSVSVQGLGTGVICKPAATWTALSSTTSGSGANQVTQEAFWTTSSSSYTFNFYATAACNTTLVKAGASLVATNYNGVDTSVAPTSTTTGNPAAAATLTAPQNATVAANEEVVSFFSTLDDFGGASVPSIHNNPSGAWTNSGEDAGPQQAAGNQAPQATATTGSSAVWAGETVDLAPTLTSSITVVPPSDYSPGGNDFLLVSVSVQGLGTGVICKPAATWTALSSTTSGSGANQVTQEAFWTTSSSSYTFNFYATAACNTTLVKAGASLVATNYNGVDTSVAPTSTTTGNPAAAATLTAPQNGTAAVNEEVVSFFSTLDDFGGASVPSNHNNPSGVWTNTGEDAGLQRPTGNQSPQASATTGASAVWAAETVDLTPLFTSAITIPAVSGYSPTDGNNDLLLASISARALGSNTICAPDANWTRIGTTSSGTGANQITQAVFWTTSSTAYQFTFNTSSSCTGSPNGNVKVAASALATNYVGVDATSVVGSTTNGTASTTLTAPSVTTTNPYSEVVSMFGTLDSWTTTPAPPAIPSPNPDGLWLNSGADNTVQAAVGGQASPRVEHTVASANWTGISVALSPLLKSSITVAPPTGYVGGGADLMMVTVSVQNLGAGSICAPDASWTRVPVSVASPPTFTVKSGAVTQEAFYTSTSEAASDAFTFWTKPNCSGLAAGLGSSAVAAYFTGVNTAVPFDVTPVPATGSADPVKPGTITTTIGGDEVVSLFGSAATPLAPAPTGGLPIWAQGNGLSPTGGLNYTNLATATANYQPASATSGTSLPWTAETIALQPLLKTGIVVQRPPSNPAANDFIVVTVTANGLPAADNICAPNDGSWTEVNGAMTTAGSGAAAVNQATWYSFRAGAAAETYAFTFQTTCSGSGNPVSGSATALAVRFTGVNPITPIEINPTTLNPNVSTTSGVDPTTGTTKQAVGPPGAVTPGLTGDWTVAMYGTGATTMSMTGCTPTTGTSPYTGFQSGTTGTASATGFCGRNNPIGSTTMPSGTAGTAGTPWVAQTLVLESAASGCSSNCEYGLEDPDDNQDFTDYALAIKAAATQLQTLAATRPTAQNVIILLSDGDANYNPGSTPYPCNAGITQAEAAENPAGLNSWFFSIAYGTNVSGGCTLDSSRTATPLTGLTAQCTMELMANNSVSNAYSAANNPMGYRSDAAAQSALCPSSTGDPDHRYFNVTEGSSLEDVFQQVGSALATPRLISNDAQ